MTQASKNRRHYEVCLLVLHSIQEQEPCFQNTEKYTAFTVEIKKKTPDEQIVIRNGTQ
jgi:hypothetical protein